VPTSVGSCRPDIVSIGPASRRAAHTPMLRSVILSFGAIDISTEWGAYYSAVFEPLRTGFERPS